jgi:hypothetical protein
MGPYLAEIRHLSFAQTWAACYHLLLLTKHNNRSSALSRLALAEPPVVQTGAESSLSAHDSELQNALLGSASRFSRLRNFLILLLLTLGALLVQGYHPGAEDAEIYLPGVEKILQPELFPFNAQFFQSHAHLTLFPNLIAASVQISHLPLEFVTFLWQLLSMFLLLWAGWELSGKCFASTRARWAGVALLAALFTLPVAGTALYLMDQYINPRNLTAFAGIFAIAKVLDKKYLQAGLFLLFAAAIHPLMPAFAIAFVVLLVVMRRYNLNSVALASWLPIAFLFQTASPAYDQVAGSHPYHYFLRWQWYEILGAVGPLAILWWFRRIARSRHMQNVDLLCQTLMVYESISIVAAVILSSSPRFEALARIQPMRSLFLLYMVMILLGGGFLAEYFLKNHVWRWVALFLPLCAGMFYAQRQLFPASAHIEWPGATPKNPWVQAFLWVRDNTPVDAVFALDPAHMEIAGEDYNGFRAIAERSMLADSAKDSGAVTMFPPLAEEWLRQVQAQKGWKNFQSQDFSRLATTYGVNWVVLQQPGIGDMSCPYQNEAVLVCRLN